MSFMKLKLWKAGVTSGLEMCVCVCVCMCVCVCVMLTFTKKYSG